MIEAFPAPWSLVAAVAGGALLALLYLALLWLSVRRVARLRSPLAWMLGSALLRVGLVLGGLWLLSGGRPDPLLAGLGGFFGARIAATAWMRVAGGARRPGPADGDRDGARAHSGGSAR